MSENQLEKLANELRGQMNELMVAAVKEPMEAALQQIPIIMERGDWTMDQKVAAVRALQVAIISPFINAAVNASHSSGMDLGLFLNYCGAAWEEVRHQHITHIAADMLKPGGEEPDGD